jgi:replicative superfamily II helicase
MPVDFSTLGKGKGKPSPIDPLDIFRRLPKPLGINDLYQSQAEVLKEWFSRRNERDLVLKLHTGGGKTLVGLLIAQSHMTEIKTPVIYLCPDNQLVDQTLGKAKEYSINAVHYTKKEDLPEQFLNSHAVLVCNYNTLFNGRSKFGVDGDPKGFTRAGLIIADDAHSALGKVRDAFTYTVRSADQKELFTALASVFREDFKKADRLQTFDEVLGGADYRTLEVPHWSLLDRVDELVALIRKHKADDTLEWRFLRDDLKYCHALITRMAFSLTPLYPLIDKIPSFANCNRRIYMSATIADDSDIIRTFSAQAEGVAKPIRSESLAGVSERMILIPNLLPVPLADELGVLKNYAQKMVEKARVSVVILAPSSEVAKQWTDVAEYPDTPEKVQKAVQDLQAGFSNGPYVFANRYDGIDLPGDACRVLIVWGLPQGASEYDLFRSSVFPNGISTHSTLALRVEQGMGRGARTSGDHCVVILGRKDLSAWIGHADNLPLLTASTRAQIEMGLEVSRAAKSVTDITDLMLRCIKRDAGWKQYHANTLAELTMTHTTNEKQLVIAKVEREAFRLLRLGQHDKAIAVITKCLEQTETVDRAVVPYVDPLTAGWLCQLASRVCHSWGSIKRSQDLQKDAFSRNPHLSRPLGDVPYLELPIPGEQAHSITQHILKYKVRRSYLAAFDSIAAQLSATSSSAQFEEALMKLGSLLGFSAERPDNTYGVGPDVLWLLNDSQALIIEAKSCKKSKNPLTKDNHGQLLVSHKWFEEKYPKVTGIDVSVHPSGTCTYNAIATNTYVLTFDKLAGLVADLRATVSELCDSSLAEDELYKVCEDRLSKSKVSPDKLVGFYLRKFVMAK